MSENDSTPDIDDDPADSSTEDSGSSPSIEPGSADSSSAPAKIARRRWLTPGRIAMYSVVIVLLGLVAQNLITKSNWNSAFAWLKEQVDQDVEQDVERAEFVNRSDVTKYMKDNYGLDPVPDRILPIVEYYHFQTPLREYTLKIRYSGENLQFSERQYRYYWMEFPETMVEESVEIPEGGPPPEGGPGPGGGGGPGGRPAG